MKNKEIPDVIIQGSMMYNPNDYKIVDKQYLNIRKDLVNQNGWQDISSAPRDGTEIIVHAKDRPFGESLTVVFWDEKLGWLFFDDGDFQMSIDDTLTHWQPLPTPPTASDLSIAVEQPTVGNSVDRDVMCDDIEQIISDTHDIDARDIDYAKNIMAYINNYNVTKKGA